MCNLFFSDFAANAFHPRCQCNDCYDVVQGVKKRSLIQNSSITQNIGWLMWCADGRRERRRPDRRRDGGSSLISCQYLVMWFKAQYSNEEKKNRAEHKRSLLMRNRTTDLFCESSWMTAGSACSRGSGREEPADWGAPPGGATGNAVRSIRAFEDKLNSVGDRSRITQTNPADCRDLVVLEKNRGEEQIHNEAMNHPRKIKDLHQALPVVYKDFSSVASPSVPLLLNITFLYTPITHFPWFWSFIHRKTRSTGVGFKGFWVVCDYFKVIKTWFRLLIIEMRSQWEDSREQQPVVVQAGGIRRSLVPWCQPESTVTPSCIMNVCGRLTRTLCLQLPCTRSISALLSYLPLPAGERNNFCPPRPPSVPQWTTDWSRSSETPPKARPQCTMNNTTSCKHRCMTGAGTLIWKCAAIVISVLFGCHGILRNGFKILNFCVEVEEFNWWWSWKSLI